MARLYSYGFTKEEREGREAEERPLQGILGNVMISPDTIQILNVHSSSVEEESRH